MAKKILKGLSGTTALVKSVLKRINIPKDASTEIAPLNSYPQNKLKEAMHPAYQELVVKDVIEYSSDVKTFVLGKEDGSALAYPQAGNYISIALEIGEAKLCRPYSLSSSPKEALEGKYTLTIKRVKDGLASNYVLDTWKKGDKIRTSAPQGTFTYEPLRDAKTVIGIAGGSGITPFFSFAKAIKDGTEDFNLILLYGSRTKNDILFLDEFEAIEKATDKFKLINVLSDEDVEGYEKGFITSDLIKKYAPDGEYSIFICGPQAMYNFIDKEIEKLNIRKKFVRHELFGEYRNPSNDNDYPEGINVKDTFKMIVNICGEKKELEICANDTILNTLEKNGIQAPNDCRSGICGYCHSRLVSGKVYVPKSVDGRRAADVQFGYIHPCCTFALSDIEIDVPPLH